jgi:hypothetical protein
MDDAKLFLKENYGIVINDDNQFNDCDFTWDMVLTFMIDYGEHIANITK